MQPSSFNESVLTLVAGLTSAENTVTYIQPMNGATPTLNYALDCGKLEGCVSPSLNPATPGQAMTAPAITMRSAGDKEKQTTGKIDQVKFALYHVGGIWDFLVGRVSNIAYPVWLKTV